MCGKQKPHVRAIMNKSAVVLLSGGLDSTVTLYYAKNKGYRLKALTVYYGQLHDVEIQKARQSAHLLEVEHHILDISLPWKGSALLDPSIPMPEHVRRGDSRPIPATRGIYICCPEFLIF